MRIAIVSQPIDPVLPPAQGSIGLWTYHAGHALSRLGHDVRVYARLGRSQYRADRNDGPRYRFVPTVPARVRSRLNVAAPATRGDEGLPPYARLLSDIDYSTQVGLATRLERPEVAHVHNFTQFVPVLRKLNPGMRIALHMNCEWLTQLDEEAMARRIETADVVLGSSNYITNLVTERFPQYAERCRTLYNGFDQERFSPAPTSDAEGRPSAEDREDIVLFVGRISPEKGVHDLIDAFCRVAPSFPRAKLKLVGPVAALRRDFIVDQSDDPLVRSLGAVYDEGDYYEYLQRLIPSGLEDRIEFAGSVPQAELPRLYREGAFLVNPSYSESFGMTVVEALACETPVVAARVGGMQEIVEDGETGLFIERGNREDIASALARMLGDTALRERMGRAGRASVTRRFSWDAVARSAVEAYEVARTRGRRS